MDDYKYFFNLGFFKKDNFDGYGEFLFKNGKKYEGGRLDWSSYGIIRDTRSSQSPITI